MMGRPLSAALAATLASLLTSGLPAAEGSAEAAKSGCVVRAWPDARYRGVGYDHIVHLANGCAFAVSCTVTTNASPRPLRAHLPAGGKRELITYRNAPGRQFSISVSCQRAAAP